MPQRTAPVVLLLGLTALSVSACAITLAGIEPSANQDRPQAGRIPEPDIDKPVSAPDRIKPPLSLPAANASHARKHFNLARSRVEAATDTDLSHVALRLVDDSLIDDEVSLETARLVNSQFEAPAFRRHFLESVMADQSGTYAALYSGNQSAVMVSRNLLSSLLASVPADGGVRDSTVMALFIHELVHAADDARYDIQRRRTLSFRASFAQSATFEGHAQWLTRKICREHGCLPGLQALDAFMFGRENQLDHSLPAVQAISRNVLEYSYVEGERFIAGVAARADGAQLLDQLLASPPRDPVQVLAPMSFPDSDREARNQHLIEAALTADHPWTMSPWRTIESSPLKGVNLRDHPARRQAAIDGFTRLITAIVAVQVYDESEPEKPPREATLIRATNTATAALFAQSLHDNTQGPEALLTRRSINLSNPRGTSGSATLYQTRLMDPPMATPDELLLPRWQTAIAVAGPHVVQMAGLVEDEQSLSRYVTAVLDRLSEPRASTSSR